MTETPSQASPLIVEQYGAVRRLRMNRPAALNALNLELIEALTVAIEKALDDDRVTTLWLESTSERSFCAGGDVKALAQVLREASADEQRRTGHRYFQAEYRLDALIAHCPKPIVAWGQGLVMGGGWGLLAGADLRLVTADARFAMPEIQIGLFPDVGAAHFLQQPDWRLGTFLGISGVHISGREAVALGYAEAVMTPDTAEALLKALAEGLPLREWQPPKPDGQTQALFDAWSSALDSLPEPVLSDWIDHIKHHDFKAFNEAAEQWQRGSALSVALTWHHFKRLRKASRVEALETDLVVGAQACAEREFLEGVRALLIDKDKSPAWLYPNVTAVPFTMIERFYRPLPFESEAIWP
ncbi:enoyl-CoA hydratase/isomerase family protein [Saccharospirillum salsuginis]|uniref:3-hydroxyisobutyryl-CoA hydrolase n=1 Tax=Saccharospirillum salsuginis TaxID=418750 RepID=A0A918KKV9_9GAMM|nr:enoyl-CoA hydratase/isomerase family protein [Saccharospirillum salsuginis]GGX65418.1 enoyl-CoA hydratase [Saccharospirillum salsuginis]